MTKRCVRCGRGPHDDQAYADCPHYVPPAPLWLRLLNRVLARLS
jgi:hypothetical protein